MSSSRQRLGFFERNDSIATEREFQQQLHNEYQFDFDPCPLVRPEWDGLEVEWGQRNWVNPPFSNIRGWVEKALAERAKGKLTVMLIPCRPNTKYWQELIFPNANELHWLPKIRFEGYDQPMPVPMVLIVFKPNCVETALTAVTKGGKRCWSTKK